MKNKENLYASIPYVDKKVSRIFAGTAFPPIQDGADGTEFFEAALANGINAFDTARAYMEAEHSFGNWLEKSGRREEVVILSKCGHPDAMWNKRVNEKEMRKDLKKSLEELKTDTNNMHLTSLYKLLWIFPDIILTVQRWKAIMRSFLQKKLQNCRVRNKKFMT